MRDLTGSLLGNSRFDPKHPQAMATVQRHVAAAGQTYRQSLKAVQNAVKRRPEPIGEKPKAMAAGQSGTPETGFESQFAF
jgi:hypothetical protein